MTPPVPVVRKPSMDAARPLLPAKKRLPLQTMPLAPDPINEANYTGDPEADAAVELKQVDAGFLARAKAEQDRFKSATDTTYYAVLVFDSGEQCSAFLRAAGINGGDDDFVDGRLVAERLGIELPKADVKFNAAPRIDPKFAAMVRKP